MTPKYLTSKATSLEKECFAIHKNSQFAMTLGDELIANCEVDLKYSHPNLLVPIKSEYAFRKFPEKSIGNIITIGIKVCHLEKQ